MAESMAARKVLTDFEPRPEPPRASAQLGDGQSALANRFFQRRQNKNPRPKGKGLN